MVVMPENRIIVTSEVVIGPAIGIRGYSGKSRYLGSEFN